MTDNKLTQFTIDGKSVPVRFVETQTVKDGVECDIYIFINDSSKDLAIVRVTKGYKTPLQRVLIGDKTIEGFYDGEGTLTLRTVDGKTDKYEFSSTDNKEVVIGIGQIMQWYADGETDLTFYEICEPPYIDGRFENLKDEEY
jgi:hypothetical protein